MNLGLKFLGYGVFLSTASNVFAATLVVAVPCGSPGLRSCEAVINGGQTVGQKTLNQSLLGNIVYGKTAGTTVTGINSKITASVSAQVSCLYQKKDPDPSSYLRGQCEGAAFGPHVCDPVPNLFNKFSAETKNDNRGDTCGVPAGLSLNVSGGQINTEATIYGNNSLEYAYINGALIQAQSCFLNQVTSEISQAHQLTVDLQSPCVGLARDTQNLGTQFAQTMKGANSELSNQANIKDIDNCDTDWNSIQGDHGRLRQSAPQLCTSRIAIESAFAQLAACEIFQRSQHSWFSRLGVVSEQNNLFNKIRDRNDPKSVNSQCYNACNGNTDMGSATRCVNDCYSGKITPFVRSYIENLWPTNPTPTRDCQSNASDSLPALPALMMFGSIALQNRKRKFPSKFPFKKKSVNKESALKLVLLLLLYFSLFACSRGPGSTSMKFDPQSCPTGMSSNYPYCPGTPKPGETSVNAPGSGAVGGSLAAGAGAIGAAQNGIGNANQLLGTQAIAGQGVSQAALAGGTGSANKGVSIDNSSLNGSGRKNNLNSLLPSSFDKAPGGSGGRATSGGGGGGSGLGNNLAVIPSSDANATTGSGGVGTDASLSAASSFGGSGSGAGKSGSNDGSGGSDGNSGLDATALAGLSHLAEDGADANGRNIAALGTQDPDDYFTRMGISDNIFKIVEKRYRTKTTRWVVDDVSAVANRVAGTRVPK